jgi:hypothetical protein
VVQWQHASFQRVPTCGLVTKLWVSNVYAVLNSREGFNNSRNNPININTFNCASSRHIRNKKREYLQDRIHDLGTNNKNKIRDLYRGINEFKRGDQKKTPWPLVRKRTIPTEQLPLVDENLMPTFVEREVSRGQHGGSPTVVNLSFLDQKER